ncbi:hypothetical protein [Propionivibrio limicola]|uniref:hypothetical protein n=1 Tax=Propionivibrio limicola TaxID=167645 RepID=UPI001292A578|nr:hypothetical protein [Propionivibrio limicola]
MENELDTLEYKVAQVVALCHALRAENQQLQQKLTNAEAEKAALASRMDAARIRLEQIAEQLPDSSNPA